MAIGRKRLQELMSRVGVYSNHFTPELDRYDWNDLYHALGELGSHLQQEEDQNKPLIQYHGKEYIGCGIYTYAALAAQALPVQTADKMLSDLARFRTDSPFLKVMDVLKDYVRFENLDV